MGEPDFGEMFEPDVYVDDLAVRLVRDSNCHQHQVPPGDGQLVPAEVPEPGELHPPGEDVHLALQPGQDTALLYITYKSTPLAVSFSRT